MINYQRKANRYINPVICVDESNPHILTLENVFTIGKYKGKTIQDVAKIDFQYLLWAKKNSIFLFSQQAKQYIYEIKKQNMENNNWNYKPRERKAEIKEKKATVYKIIYVFDKDYKKIDSGNYKYISNKYNLSIPKIRYCMKALSMCDEKYYFSFNEFESFIPY